MILQQEPQLARLHAVIEKYLGAVEKQIKLLQAKHRRHGEGGIGIPEKLKEDEEDLNFPNQRPGIPALKRPRAVGEGKDKLQGDGGEGADERHLVQIHRGQEGLQRRRSPPPQRGHYRGGSHGIRTLPRVAQNQK